MKRKIALFFVFGAMLFGSLQMLDGVSAQARLTLGMVLTGLQTKGTTPETNTLAKRNLYIQRQVEERGVTFRVTPEIETELRNAGATASLIAAIRQNGPSAVTTPTPSGRPRALFKDLWIDYDVTEGSQKGMRIHVKFTAYSMRNLDSYLAIYFTDSTGAALRDKNDKFNSSAGEVAVYREMKPGFDPADYDDFTVFMPYDELDLGNGNWDLGMDVKIIYKAGGLITELTKKQFNYKQGPARPTIDEDSVTAKVNRVWIDYNVTEGGVRGMRIHVNFEVTGLKGVASELAVRVQNEDGEMLESSSNVYSNDAGELRTFFKMNPGYPTTVYKDATMFLPYQEIIIGKGKWNLKLDIDINHDDGELIKHLQFYEFEFTRN
jgi:hypothetical protein